MVPASGPTHSFSSLFGSSCTLARSTSQSSMSHVTNKTRRRVSDASARQCAYFDRFLRRAYSIADSRGKLVLSVLSVLSVFLSCEMGQPDANANANARPVTYTVASAQHLGFSGSTVTRLDTPIPHAAAHGYPGQPSATLAWNAKCGIPTHHVGSRAPI
ncbi:hypothetical protein F4818DRAFT_235277 [Hypoxylon cercidicola]|nr:hypothetical protein F4818DRAFT_235277 [Hypoxylon cercidicola]